MAEIDITIPPEALQKAWETYLKENCGPHAFEAACIAMLKAWPGMQIVEFTPLPQEKTDD